MFMVLAVGTLMDPSLPAYNLEAEKYHQLARSALFQGTTFDDPTLNAVQAVVSPFSPLHLPLPTFVLSFV